MIAIDTNVVLRIVLGDDEAQLTAALDLMKRGKLFVSLSVLLEAGWVLESRYGFSRSKVADTLGLLRMLEGMVVARGALVDWTLSRYRHGADLGDMIHLASSAKLDRFATFDRRLAKRAGHKTPVPIETLV